MCLQNNNTRRWTSGHPVTELRGEPLAEIRISSEKDAFDLIQLALAGEMRGGVEEIVFDNWPKLNIELKGEG